MGFRSQTEWHVQCDCCGINSPRFDSMDAIVKYAMASPEWTTSGVNGVFCSQKCADAFKEE